MTNGHTYDTVNLLSSLEPMRYFEQYSGCSFPCNLKKINKTNSSFKKDQKSVIKIQYMWYITSLMTDLSHDRQKCTYEICFCAYLGV